MFVNTAWQAFGAHIKPSCCIKLWYQISNRVNLKLSSNKSCCKYFVSSTVIWGNQPANTCLDGV